MSASVSDEMWTDEMVRRLEGWAEYQMTRRPQAEGLASLLCRNNPIRLHHHYTQWCFVWEITGDRATLRKIVERLLPMMRRDQLAIMQPPRWNRQRDRSEM